MYKAVSKNTVAEWARTPKTPPVWDVKLVPMQKNLTLTRRPRHFTQLALSTTTTASGVDDHPEKKITAALPVCRLKNDQMMPLPQSQTTTTTNLLNKTIHLERLTLSFYFIYFVDNDSCPLFSYIFLPHDAGIAYLYDR